MRDGERRRDREMNPDIAVGLGPGGMGGDKEEKERKREEGDNIMIDSTE